MFTLKMETGNDAFRHGNKREEVNRLLQQVRISIQNGAVNGSLIDINGNKVGEWRMTKD